MNHFQLVGFNQVTWKHSKFKCFVVWTLMSLYLDFNISVLLVTNFTSMENHSSKDKVLLTLESRAVCCNYKQESLRLFFSQLSFSSLHKFWILQVSCSETFFMSSEFLWVKVWVDGNYWLVSGMVFTLTYLSSHFIMNKFNFIML